jgi:hypothetical protein
MNDALIERVAREDPARAEALTNSSRLEQDRAMRARLLAVIDRESPPAVGHFRGRGGSLLAAGASIAIVVAVIAVFATVDHQTIPPKHAAPADRERPTAIPAKPVELYAAGVVDVGAPPQALLASGDALYVATPRSVVRLNLRNGSTIARTPIPTNGVNAGLAFGAGSIWLAPTGSTQLLRIDPTTGRLVGSIHVGASVDGPTGSLGGGVAYAAGTVWATRLSSGPRGDVVTVNPATNRIEGTPATVGTGPDAIVFGLGSLWVDNTSIAIGSTPVSTTYSSLSRIDPRTQRVTTVPFSGTPTIGFGSLWILTNAESDNGAVVRYESRDRADRHPTRGRPRIRRWTRLGDLLPALAVGEHVQPGQRNRGALPDRPAHRPRHRNPGSPANDRTGRNRRVTKPALDRRLQQRQGEPLPTDPPSLENRSSSSTQLAADPERRPDRRD